MSSIAQQVLDILDKEHNVGPSLELSDKHRVSAWIVSSLLIFQEFDDESYLVMMQRPQGIFYKVFTDLGECLASLASLAATFPELQEPFLEVFLPNFLGYTPDSEETLH